MENKKIEEMTMREVFDEHLSFMTAMCNKEDHDRKRYKEISRELGKRIKLGKKAIKEKDLKTLKSGKIRI